MHRKLFRSLLEETSQAYCAHPSLMAFSPFCDDLVEQTFTPNIRMSCGLMQSDKGLESKGYAKFQKVILDAAPHMHWRDTYHNSELNTDFMDSFGSFAIIGDRAPFGSRQLRAFIVYMPSGLLYPWHRHPAEEMYLVLSGSGTFKRFGETDIVLTEGQAMFHERNEIHALETTGSPILCLVVWRNEFDTPPILVADPNA